MKRHANALLSAGTALLVVCAASLTASADVNVRWPELFQTAVAKPVGATAKYAYEVVSVDGEGKLRLHAAYDPSKPKGQRFSLLELSEELKKAREAILADFEKGGDDIWCDSMTENVKGSVKLAADNAETATFLYTPTDPDVDGDRRNLIEKTDATMVVDKSSGRIRSVQWSLPKPTRIKLVAKIDSFQLFGTCTPTSSGRAYRTTTTMKVEGSVLGNSLNETTVQRIENLRLVKSADES